MKIKYIVSAILLCIFLGISYHYFNKIFVVRIIQLELQDKPVWVNSKKKLKNRLQLKLKKFIGQKIGSVSFREIIHTIRTESNVGSIKILKKLPNRLFIQLHSRKPLLVLLNPNSKKIHPLSIDGKILPPLPAHKIPNLPILRGTFFLKKIENRKRALDFFTLIPDTGYFSQSKISEVNYSQKEKSLIFILSINGKPIKVGYEPLNMKTKKIEIVLKYLMQKHIKWRVIDARFSQKIVVSTHKTI